MKILFYDWALHNLGGGQKFDCKIIEHLSKKHDVDILTLFPIDIKKIEQAYNVDFSRIKRVISLYDKNNGNSSKLHLFSYKKVSEISKNYDLFFNADAHETVNPKARHNIMYCHFFEPKIYRKANNIIDFFKLAFVYLFKTFAGNYSRKYKIYCNSNYTKFWLKRLWKVDSKIIYPPIDIPKTISKNKKNIILSTGRLTPDKNYEFVIDCFKKVYNENKNYECIICGIKYEEEYYQKLLRLSRGYPIKIITNLTDKELNEIYDKAKIFVQAKGLNINEKKYPGLLEHFGMAAAEAMAHGCIPIVLNKGGYRETVEDKKTGFLFNNREEAISNLSFLMKNEKERRKMEKDARKRAKLFSLERMQKQIDEAINSL